MCRRMLYVTTAILFAAKLSAQYPVAAIPDSLTKNAKMVVRLEEEVYELKSPGKATEHEREVYTILNDDAKQSANYSSYYDKFTSINYIDGILYDATGKEIKHVKKKDMADESGSDDETLMTDTRYKVYNMEYGIYPYTVSFEEEDDIDGIMHLPSWYPQSRPGIAVQESRLVIITPKDYVLRYQAFNFKTDPVITEQQDKKTYTWEIKNLPAKQSEENAPDWRELVPYVMVAPSAFEVQGYKGDMSTWNSYGKFYTELLQGRDVLPDDIKRKVHELTDGLTDPAQKVYALYDFMQKNTRYISIQLGIGGWQPLDASFVAAKKYGDCKALSNYMVALLKEAGIKGHPVIIRSGDYASPIIENFPSHQFDHVIACVPMQKDTIWLECTDQTIPAGFLGAFTANRKGMMVDEDGGHLVSTPAYLEKDNLEIRNVNAAVDADGNLDADLNTKYSGLQEELPHELIYDVSKEEREKFLNRELNLPTYQIDKSNYSEQKGKVPTVSEYLHLTSPSYASVSGRRLFISPNLFNKIPERLKPDTARKYDYLVRVAATDIDSVHLKIPDGYSPEAVPKNVSITNKFGTYNISYTITGSNILCVRYFEKNMGRYHPGDYMDIVKFYDDMYKADRSKIVFVKKDS